MGLTITKHMYDNKDIPFIFITYQIHSHIYLLINDNGPPSRTLQYGKVRKGAHVPTNNR